MLASGLWRHRADGRTRQPPQRAAETDRRARAPAEGAKKIGFSVYDMQYGFFQDMEAGTREAAEAAGYEYTLVDQKSSESTMVASTMDLLNQGVDALIISPFKPDAMGPIVDAAKEKGIPVVVNDIGGGGTDYDVIVISDNYNGGVMAAEEMDRLISAAGKPKKVASITCEPSAVYAARRNEGFEAKMDETGLRGRGHPLRQQPHGGRLQGHAGHPLRQPRRGRRLLLQRPHGRRRCSGHRRRGQERLDRHLCHRLQRRRDRPRSHQGWHHGWHHPAGALTKWAR